MLTILELQEECGEFLRSVFFFSDFHLWFKLSPVNTFLTCVLIHKILLKWLSVVLTHSLQHYF